jgi:hypothetical protein
MVDSHGCAAWRVSTYGTQNRGVVSTYKTGSYSSKIFFSHRSVKIKTFCRHQIEHKHYDHFGHHKHTGTITDITDITVLTDIADTTGIAFIKGTLA